MARENLGPLSSKQLLSAFRTMLLIRRFEEKVGQLYASGLIGGFCHLYVGQEALVTGVQLQLQAHDQTIASYRDHAHALAAGVEPTKILAELLGRRTGLSKGKAGSMHLYAPENGFFGGHAIVGAQVSLGTGLALAQKRAGKGQVTVVFLGEGAANQGQVYECLTMAQKWQLPVLYVIENNRHALEIAKENGEAIDFSGRARAFGVKAEQVEGIEVEVVYEATGRALAHCGNGHGPYLLDIETMRYRGHSLADPAKYFSHEDLLLVRDFADPLDLARASLLDRNLINPEQLAELEQQIRTQISDAAEFAAHQSEPEIGELYSDVYA